MKAQPVLATPDQHIAVAQRNPLSAVRTLQPTEQEYRWQTQRNRHDRLAEVCFVTATAQALATLDYVTHMTKRYVRKANRPKSLADLQDYMLVHWQGDAEVTALAPWQALLQARSGGVTLIEDYEMY